MVHKFLLLFLMSWTVGFSQTGNNIRDIDIALIKVFTEYELNVLDKDTDPESGHIIYTITGIGNKMPAFEKDDKTEIDILIFQERANKNFSYVVMETLITTPNLTTEEQYNLINKWSEPPARAHISWINKNKINLSITDVLITKGDNYPRLQDAMISLFGGLYDIKKKLQ